MPVVIFPTGARTYEGTVQDVIDRARYVLQDEGRDRPGDPVNPALYRWTDAEFFLWINDALSAALQIRPALFVKQAMHQCTAGYYQTLSVARAVELVDIIGLPIADVAALTQFSPGWQSAPAASAKNWMRAPGDLLSFYLSPPSPSNQTLPVMLTQAHVRVDSPDDVIELPEVYIQAIADYVVAMAEAKDDEQIDANRQQAALAAFASKIKGGQ